MGMPRYRRIRQPGGTYFFTVNLAQRGDDLLLREIDLLRAAMRATLADRPVRIDAMVVLPDHLHAVWTLPKGDADYSTRWGAIKARFVQGLRRAGVGPPPDLPPVVSGRYAGLKPGLRTNKREAGIWQRRFWEHTIRNEADFRRHVAYCWGNPVKHGLVARPMDWPFSSIHRDHARGLVPPGWTGGLAYGRFGE